MFTEVMIFAAFFAVTFVAHFVHARRNGAAPDVEVAGRVALVGAVAAKAVNAALHDYMLHIAEVVVHAVAH